MTHIHFFDSNEYDQFRSVLLSAKMSTKRLHLEFSEETLKALQEMQLKLGLNKKQVLETALDILIWIVRKKTKRNAIFCSRPNHWKGDRTCIYWVRTDRARCVLSRLLSI